MATHDDNEQIPQPDHIEFDITPEQAESILNRVRTTKEYKAQFGGKLTASANFTPDVLARLFQRLAPLQEGEKVLKDWLAGTGGIIYGDGRLGVKWGYYVMNNRPGSEGIELRRDEQAFSTFSQCLEYCLDFAAGTIRGNVAREIYRDCLIDFAKALMVYGVEQKTIDAALEDMQRAKEAASK